MSAESHEFGGFGPFTCPLTCECENTLVKFIRCHHINIHRPVERHRCLLLHAARPFSTRLIISTASAWNDFAEENSFEKLSRHIHLHEHWTRHEEASNNSYSYFHLQLLNKRIETFINSYKNSTNHYPDTKPYVEGEMAKLQSRWNEFKDKSQRLKNSLAQAQQYYSLLDVVSLKIEGCFVGRGWRLMQGGGRCCRVEGDFMVHCRV
jgi:hypothetical protein